MANKSAIAPIVVPPSQAWDGNDGPWSTFNIHVGTPPQPARVLVSTAVGETWVVSANTTQGGCLSLDPSTCPQSRGDLVNVNQSTTWQDQGIFGLGLEVNLPDYTGPYDNGDYGLDTLGFGLAASDGVSLNNMVVAAIATKDFYLGNLGITDRPTNFSSFNDPHPSFLSSLKNQSKIPSLSFGYSAGAEYRLKKAVGTLTLGGYDASKFTPNGLSFQFAPDISRDLVVGLQSIEFTDAKTTNGKLLSEGILTFIDSTVPHIWLPGDACQAFEDAFGIEYNSTVDRYLVNDTLHDQLMSQNASVSFILGNDINGGSTVNITLPYSSFDLLVGPPIVDETQRYFPLRQAANDTQFTLGRTFLQESYLIVNYETSNFSVSQNTWIENAPSQIMTIASINDTSVVTKTTNNHKISIGGIVGLIAAAVALCLIAAGAIYYTIRRKRKKREEEEKSREAELNQFDKPEMDGTGKPVVGELYSEHKLGEEMEGSKPGMGVYAADVKNRTDLEGRRVAEMEGTRGGVEMEGSRAHAEMEGTDFAPVEMYAGPHGLYELPTPIDERSELPSPVSASRSRRSRIASWGRRQQSTPKPPDSEAGDASSPDKERFRRRDGTEMWSGRGRRQKGTRSPNDVSSQSEDSRERQRSGPNIADVWSRRLEGLEGISRSNTPMEVSSQSERSRGRHEIGVEQSSRRMESISRTTTPFEAPSPIAAPSPVHPSGDEPRGSRLGSAARSRTPREAPSPMEGSRERNRQLGDTSGTPPFITPNSPRPPGNFF